VTFTATVNSSSGVPSGSVTFVDGSTQLGTPSLALGQATFSTSSLSIGSHSITASYGGNSSFLGSSASLTQKVSYGVCALYDQTKSVHSGAVIPIKLQLCDINSSDVSSSSIVVHATGLTGVSSFSGDVGPAGNSAPDNDFRFDATLGPTGGYIFNLSTSGLATGTYNLQFMAGSDPLRHSVNFGVK
jgi:hypothetical protein